MERQIIEIEDSLNKISLDSVKKDDLKEDKDEKGPILEFKEYLISSTFGERIVYLPSLEFLTSMKCFFPLKEVNVLNEKVSISSIISYLVNNCSSEKILETCLIFLGSINKNNEEYYKQYKLKSKSSSNYHFLDNFQQTRSYEAYIKDNIDFIFSEFKYPDYKELLSRLQSAGLIIDSITTENFMLLSRNKVYDNDKVLIVICGNNFSWFKCGHKSIHYSMYDASLNKYTYIYWNKSFLEEALARFFSHPRVEIGFISSMQEKNLAKIMEAMKLSFGKYFSQTNKKIWVFHQDDHNKKQQSKDSKPGDKEEFFRSMDKIMKKSGYDETNTVILEADDEKTNEYSNTSQNTIMLPYFVDEVFLKNTDGTSKIPEVNKVLIDRIISEVIDECSSDIRINISKYNSKTKDIGYIGINDVK